LATVEDVVVRQATPADIPKLAELRREFTYEDPPRGEPRSDYEDAFTTIVGGGLRDGSWVCWAAEVSGDIVAHAFVAVVQKVPRPLETPRSIGYLTNVYTQPSFRSQGLGGRVLEAVTHWAEASGVELLVVWPSEGSVPLYRRHGFESRAEPLVWINPALSDES
jgi:GNAT superfamily N-acetyltransferase